MVNCVLRLMIMPSSREQEWRQRLLGVNRHSSSTCRTGATIAKFLSPSAGYIQTININAEKFEHRQRKAPVNRSKNTPTLGTLGTPDIHQRSPSRCSAKHYLESLENVATWRMFYGCLVGNYNQHIAQVRQCSVRDN